MESSAGSFYWYDLETTGTDPKHDRVVQFAGLRTDLNLEPVEEPFVTYVRLAPEI
nr:exonuclease domain-containing protein [Pseudomonadales bacterium]